MSLHKTYAAASFRQEKLAFPSSSLTFAYFQLLEAHLLQELDRIHLPSCLLVINIWTGRVAVKPEAAVH